MGYGSTFEGIAEILQDSQEGSVVEELDQGALFDLVDALLGHTEQGGDIGLGETFLFGEVEDAGGDVQAFAADFGPEVIPTPAKAAWSGHAGAIAAGFWESAAGQGVGRACHLATISLASLGEWKTA